jgi:transporter family-2 protein
MVLGKFLPFIMAALAGSLMAIQGTFNSILGKIIGLMEGTFAVHVIGAITAGVVLLIFGNGQFGKADRFHGLDGRAG